MAPSTARSSEKDSVSVFSPRLGASESSEAKATQAAGAGVEGWVRWVRWVVGPRAHFPLPPNCMARMGKWVSDWPHAFAQVTSC